MVLPVLAATVVSCGGDTGHPDPDEAGPSGRVFLFGYEKSDRGAVDHVGVYTVDLPGGEPERARLPELGIGDPPEFIEVTGNRLVFYGVGGATYSIGLDLSGEPNLLGRSWYFVPSATEGRTWLTYIDRKSPPTIRDLGGAQEVTVDGAITVEGRTTRTPCRGPTVVAAVQHALLCQDGQRLIAFDPRSGYALRRLPGVFPLATGGDLVASCDEPCPRLHVSDPVAGEDLEIEPEHSFRWTAGYDGDFSPDASLLAVPANPTTFEGQPRDRRWIALIDITTRSVELVVGGKSFVKGPMTFSSSGEWLFFTTRDGALMALRPGDQSAREVAHVDDLVILDLAAA
jgi:hypothetical protein